MELVVHIGQSKTGTSAIQRYLANNREQLEESGVFYPALRAGGITTSTVSHNWLANAAARPGAGNGIDARAFVEDAWMRARERSCGSVVLSGEYFFGGIPQIWDCHSEENYFEIYKAKLRRLADILEGNWKLRILIYLRGQVSWFASAINQNIKSAFALRRDGNVYESDRSFFELSKPLLRYGRRLDLWERHLRPSTFEVVPYRASALHQGDAVSDFRKRLGIEHSSPEPDRDRLTNESLSVECLEVKKRLNRNKLGKDREMVAIDILLRMSAASTYGRSYHVDDEVVEDLVRWVAVDNEALSGRYLPAGQVLDAMEGYSGGSRVPDEKDIRKAQVQFEESFNQPSARLKVLRSKARRYLRRRSPALFAALQQARQRVHPRS